MAAFRIYGPTNQPGTCLWCGRTLTQTTDKEYIQVPHKYGGLHHEWTGRRIARWEGRVGVSGDEHFCTQGCGYQFGVVLARGGRRLVPASELKGAQP